MDIALVVATIRDVDFLLSWRSCLSDDISIIVVEDRPTRECKIPREFHHTWHYCWEDIDEELGENAWIIPRQTSAIKAYGFYNGHRK